MKILFIAPLPPPINGQSLASEVFMREIIKNNELSVVDMVKKEGNGILGVFKRALEMPSILVNVYNGVHSADVIYLTISESVLGNLKDLLMYLICFKKLDRMFIHLHGGAGMIKIMRGKNVLLAHLNKIFIRRLKGVIILGESHKVIFERVMPSNKIHIVPNFAEDYLFVEEDQVERKFKMRDKIIFLFLSNFLYGKGYLELLDAYISLSNEVKSRIIIDFAGAFVSETAKNQFIYKISKLENIRYHGVVKGDEKKRLFESAHVFCLPTYYPYEGQPISILEAYAAGCVVVSTNHSGIRDIFQDKANGYEVEIKSSDSIKCVMERIVMKPHELQAIGVGNRKIAENKYRISFYTSSLKKVMGI